MKTIFLTLLTVYSCLVFSQTESHKEKFRELEPDMWLSIWDQKNSDQHIQIDTLSYDDIPRYIDFRGTVVEALKWTDNNGENILIQTVTGAFFWKEYNEDSTDYSLNDKSELYAYLYTKKKGETEYTRTWKMYDYTLCFGVDMYTGFIPKATTITDVDKDGTAEIAMPYVLICRGGMDPGVMKIIMYEGTTKYALRGKTMVFCNDANKEEGLFEPSSNLQDNKNFMSFLTKRWELHKCENERFY